MHLIACDFFETAFATVRRGGGAIRALTLLFLLSAFSLRAERLVTISALAEPAYAQRRLEPDLPPETYIMAKGQQTLGADTGLRKVPFSTIVTTLSSDLLIQHFTPAPNGENADLVIVVHWGMTDDNQNGAALLQYDPDTLRRAAEAVTTARQREASDVSGVTRALGAAAAAEANFSSELRMAESLYQGNPRTSLSNADLLGFNPALNRDDTVGDALRSMVDEERYFVILVAYDARELRAGKKQQRWVTRMSIRAAGVNFPMALDRMSGVAAHFNGTRQPSIILLESGNRHGEKPDAGNVVVIGDKPATAAPKKK
jgi:hypothetical protein